MHNMIFFITGSQGSGKTTFLIELIEILKQKGITAGGFSAHGYWKNNLRDKFELEDLKTGNKMILCKRQPVEGWQKFRHFYFNPEGFTFGQKALSSSNLSKVDIIAIDEIGPFELEGKGWSKDIDSLIHKTDIPMIWVVRESILQEIIDHWNIESYIVFDIKTESPEKIADKILNP